MSVTAGSATSMLAGDEGNPNNAPAPTQAPTPTGAPAPTATPSSWTEGWAAEDAGLVEKKGWRSPQDLFNSYRNLEKNLGSDKVILPKDANDADGWNAVYSKLGRPESADKYQFPDGVDQAAIKELAPQLHKLGITQAQAEALAKLDLARVAQAQTMQQEHWNADQAAAVNKLNQEWGAEAPKNIELNRRAMRAMGLSVDEATAYMNGGGAEKFLRMLNMVGKTIAEDNSGALDSETSLGFGMTPNRAAMELQSFKDAGGMEKIAKGDRYAKAKYDQLLKQTQGARREVGGTIR